MQTLNCSRSHSRFRSHTHTHIQKTRMSRAPLRILDSSDDSGGEDAGDHSLAALDMSDESPVKNKKDKPSAATKFLTPSPATKFAFPSPGPAAKKAETPLHSNSLDDLKMRINEGHSTHAYKVVQPIKELKPKVCMCVGYVCMIVYNCSMSFGLVRLVLLSKVYICICTLGSGG